MIGWETRHSMGVISPNTSDAAFATQAMKFWWAIVSELSENVGTMDFVAKSSREMAAVFDSMKFGCSSPAISSSGSGAGPSTNSNSNSCPASGWTTANACSLFIAFLFLDYCFFENRRLVLENPSQVTYSFEKG